MLKDEIIQRLERIAKHAVHTKGEEPYVMSLDDGVAILDAINMIKTKDTVETCADRISIQTALDAIMSIITHADEIYNAVLNLPPTQPERRTGQWKMQTIKGKDIVYCSECGFGVHEEETRRYSYCPNCGADMRGVQDEGSD